LRIVREDGRGRRPGRPPLDDNDESVGVHVRLPSREYDAVYEKARRERVTVPEVIRRAVRSLREDE
jgi:hypothetical protein